MSGGVERGQYGRKRLLCVLRQVRSRSGPTCLALIVLSPLLALIALLVRWQLGAPVLFRQQRPGRHSQPFMLCKFRTMMDARDAHGNSDLHAATGLAQRDRLAEFTDKRRANAAYLNAHIESVLTPKVREGYSHVWHHFTVRVNGGRDRDAAVKKLNDAEIGTGIFCPVSAHQQDDIRQMSGDVSLPVASGWRKRSSRYRYIRS